jgi:hypothetical protein
MSARTARTARTASRASFRTPRTRLLAAATIAVAAFALTACEDGTGTETSSLGSTSAGTSAAGSASNDASSAGTAESGSGSGSGSAKGGTNTGSDTNAGGGGSKASGSQGSGKQSSAGQSAGKEDSGKPGKCTASTVRFTATVVSRPVNHMLLTATNHGAKSCVLPAYPMARFGEAQSVPPVMDASRPQSTVVLSPGGSGYAGVLLSAADGSGSNGYTAKTLTVPFDDDSVGSAALPSGGVHVDDSLKVTYWQSGMDDALAY